MTRDLGAYGIVKAKNFSMPQAKINLNAQLQGPVIEITGLVTLKISLLTWKSQ
jgi:hypothetical protein